MRRLPRAQAPLGAPLRIRSVRRRRRCRWGAAQVARSQCDAKRHTDSGVKQGSGSGGTRRCAGPPGRLRERLKPVSDPSAARQWAAGNDPNLKTPKDSDKKRIPRLMGRCGQGLSMTDPAAHGSFDDSGQSQSGPSDEKTRVIGSGSDRARLSRQSRAPSRPGPLGNTALPPAADLPCLSHHLPIARDRQLIQGPVGGRGDASCAAGGAVIGAVMAQGAASESWAAAAAV